MRKVKTKPAPRIVGGTTRLKLPQQKWKVQEDAKVLHYWWVETKLTPQAGGHCRLISAIVSVSEKLISTKLSFLNIL